VEAVISGESFVDKAILVRDKTVLFAERFKKIFLSL
jgi:hypothetical protein